MGLLQGRDRADRRGAGQCHDQHPALRHRLLRRPARLCVPPLPLPSATPPHRSWIHSRGGGARAEPNPPQPGQGTADHPNRAADWSEDQQELFCFRLVDHYTRFLRSAKLLIADIPYDAQALADITVELLRKENFKGDVYMRPLLYKADLHGPLQLHDMEDEITIYALPRAGAPSEEGLRLTTSSWRRIDDTMMPARGKLVGAYVNSALIKSEALLAGYDDAVVLTQDGHVSECSGSNLFLIRDGVLCAQALLSTLWPPCCCLLSDADLVVSDLADERTPRQHTLLIP